MSRVFKRQTSWWIDFKDAQGVRRRKKIGPSKRIAQEVLDGMLGSVARRQHLGVIEDSAISFADFAQVWQDRVMAGIKPRTRERWLGILHLHLRPAFPGSLRSITAGAIDSYIGRRREREAAPATINREITVIKHIMKRAVLWEYLSVNAAAGVKTLKEPSGRTRFLTLEEIDHLLNACELAQLRHYLRPFVVVALNSGMRRNEILGLTRRSIDWTNRLVTLEGTKNGTTRHVHLNDAAFEALRALPARLDNDRLFPFNPNQVSMALRRAIKAAGIEDCRLHDLRHTFASYQAMAGTQGRGLQAMLGHRDARMTMRYSHLSDAYLKTAINAVNLGAAAPQPAKATR
jgi:integrase